MGCFFRGSDCGSALGPGSRLLRIGRGLLVLKLNVILRVFVYGIRFARKFGFFVCGTQGGEGLEAAFKLAREASFVTEEKSERGRGLGELAEGEGGLGGVVRGFVGRGCVVGRVVHLVVEQGGFHGPGAVETPAGDGHFVDDEVLGDVGRGVPGDEGLVEEVEFGGILVGKADGVRGAFGRHGEAVAGGGVGGGAGFAFGRDGPVGFFPVGTGGGAAAFG